MKATTGAPMPAPILAENPNLSAIAKGGLFLKNKISAGPEVSAFQTAMVHAGFVLDADGIFGDKTEAAVRQLQKMSGLAEDGVVGKKTLAALQAAINTKAATASTQSAQSALNSGVLGQVFGNKN